MGKLSNLYRIYNELHSAVPKVIGGGFALPPMRVGCVLTHRCNLRCSMCFVWQHGTRHQKEELSTDEWLRIFDEIPQSAIITFTGGEPLVRSDFKALFLEACKGHRVHLVSNGTRFTDEIAEMCIESAARNLLTKGLLSVGMSLEGPPEVHDKMVHLNGAYEKTTSALRQLVELKRRNGLKYPILDLKIVICRDTHGSLIKLYELAEDIGLDMISYQQCSTQESSYGIDQASPDAMNTFPPPVESIDRKELIRELNALKKRAKTSRTELRFNPEMPVEYFADRYENKFPLKKFTCSAAWSIMHIGPYGTVYPCFSIPMGNLKKQELREIWNGKSYREFRKKLKSAKIFPGCVGCCVMKPADSM